MSDLTNPGRPEIGDNEDSSTQVDEVRIARIVFVAVLADNPLASETTFDAIMSLLDVSAETRMKAARRSEESIRQALSKLHGDWFEWLLCIISQRVQAAENTKYVAVRLPNVLRFDSNRLYQPALQEMLSTLKAEVRRAGVELISSNPDFVLVSRERLNVGSSVSLLAVDIIDWHENRYLELKDQCAYDDIRGYLAAKYTLRPDRRLQIPHEGSLMKALYVHLQTRLWKTEPIGLVFHAVASKVGPADRTALHTVATHSITSVGSKPQAAVDRVFETKTVGDAEKMFREILNS